MLEETLCDVLAGLQGRVGVRQGTPNSKGFLVMTHDRFFLKGKGYGIFIEYGGPTEKIKQNQNTQILRRSGKP